MSQEPREVALVDAMRDCFAAGDAAYAEALVKIGRPTSCARGCNACCDLLNLITWPEGLVLAEAIAERGELARDIAALLDQVERGAREVLGPAEYFARRIRCALLAPDGSCSLYALRPFSCRFHVVFSPPVACDDRTPDSPVETVDPVRRSIGALQVLRPVLDAFEKDPLARACAPLPVMVLEALRRFGVEVPETIRPLEWHARYREAP